VLDPTLAAAGIYPAIDFTASRISGEEHIREGSDLDAVRGLRVRLSSMSAEEASAEVRRMIADSPDNAALIASITG
jgi:transcription termination factor Rho